MMHFFTTHIYILHFLLFLFFLWWWFYYRFLSMNMEVIQVKQSSFKDFATRNFTFPTLGHTQFTAVRSFHMLSKYIFYVLHCNFFHTILKKLETVWKQYQLMQGRLKEPLLKNVIGVNTKRIAITIFARNFIITNQYSTIIINLIIQDFRC